MRLLVGLTLVVSALCLFGETPQPAPNFQQYEDKDAYDIYSSLLPHEESYGFASDDLVIRKEAMFGIVSSACLTSEAAQRFRGAILDLYRKQNKRWLLQPLLQIQKNYRLLDSSQIAELPKSPRGSAKVISMSVVGFNRSKTLAVVYMESSCGGLCGSGRPHILEKVAGKWKELSGVTCAVAS